MLISNGRTSASVPNKIIHSSGNVGMGTFTPNSILQVGDKSIRYIVHLHKGNNHKHLEVLKNFPFIILTNHLYSNTFKDFFLI